MLVRVVLFEREARFWRPDVPWFRIYRGVNRDAIAHRLIALGYQCDHFGEMLVFNKEPRQ